MSYITPVTDRDADDIAAQNSKAYFNVADWERIYNNARLMVDLANIFYDSGIVWTEVTVPTIKSIPAVADFNSMLTAIEAARVDLNLSETPTAIKTDWEAGPTKVAPKYTDVNLWETVIDVL